MSASPPRAKESRRIGRDGLSDLQRRVARMLGAGHTTEAAAQWCGINRRTITTWKSSQPAFLDAIQTAKEEAADPSVVDVLRDLLNHQDPKVRLEASKELRAWGRPAEGEGDTSGKGKLVTFE